MWLQRPLFSEGVVVFIDKPVYTEGMAEDGNKELNEEALRLSVIDRPQQRSDSPQLPGGYESTLVWLVASAADEIEPWGRRPKRRDFQLRQFYPTESLFSSALGMVISRNAAFSWYIEGATRTQQKMRRILEDVNAGEGWANFIAKLSQDLYAQDHGAFVEIIREPDEPTGALVALNNLDSGRCWHTGDPESPVIYQDRKGRYHLLKWWQVVTFTELPTAVEGLYGLQICSLSRLLLAAQITKSMSIYRYEKISGRHAKAIHLVKGFNSQQLQDALTRMQANADASGFLRYVQPILLGSHDPKAEVGHDTIELASMPDGFSEDTAFKHYVAQIAMAFLSDYQEFAPLPGGNLGTSSQSEVLHQKMRGKGPALFMKLLTHKLNSRIMPDNVEFGFAEPDLEAEMTEANVRLARARERKERLKSGEISVEEARQMAADAGDLPQEMLQNPDLTPTKPPLRDVEQPDRTTGQTVLGNRS